MKISQLDNGSVRISETYISLKDTFECGQCFRWNEYKDGYIGVAKGRVLYVKQNDFNEIIMENTTLAEAENLWTEYFDLNTDYDGIISSIPPEDEYLSAAAECGRGIRILKQDPSETVISFIISANNNIKRIKKIVEKLSSMYGDKISYNNDTYYSFPSLSALAHATLEELQELHAGYRDKYLLDAFSKLPDFDFSEKDSEKLRKNLLGIKGVGPKVCDCIRLFGFSEYDAFPKDVWIKRVLKEHYGEDFNEKSLGKYAGVYQQYMFHYARNAQKEN